ncbi:MAG: AAA family ATPase [Leptolyngbyaceae bacterium]|nr:AAA family ATPase [Leptolyngbyaceae bacterium]
MQRILIIGSGGAGKSTLADHIANTLQLELIHLDAFDLLDQASESTNVIVLRSPKDITTFLENLAEAPTPERI